MGYRIGPGRPDQRPDGRFVCFQTEAPLGTVIAASDVSGAKAVFFERIRKTPPIETE